MSVKLQTEHDLEIISLTGGCEGSSESTLVKMSHCWKSHVAAHIYNLMPKVLFILPHISLYAEPSQWSWDIWSWK